MKSTRNTDENVDRSRLRLLGGLSSTAAAGLCAQYSEGPPSSLHQVSRATTDGIHTGNRDPFEAVRPGGEGGEGGGGGGGGSH